MSLVSGLSHHPIMHHHDGHHYSLHAAGRCHEKPGAPPYFTSWLINHTDISPTEYSLAAGYSPDYHGNSGSGSTCSLDPPHPQLFGADALVPGTGAISVGGFTVGVHDNRQHTPPRTVKRRPTANRKERRRTQSINSAFAELRERIPNVPADTKLSKIKTLRLATSYISYLMDILEKDGHNEEPQAFKADLKETLSVRGDRRRDDAMLVSKITSSSSLYSSSVSDKKSKGRTGWPQHVWALELNQ